MFPSQLHVLLLHIFLFMSSSYWPVDCSTEKECWSLIRVIALLLQTLKFQGNLYIAKSLDTVLAWLSLLSMVLCGLRALLLFLWNAGPSLGFSTWSALFTCSHVTFPKRHKGNLFITNWASWWTKEIISPKSVLGKQWLYWSNKQARK